MRTLWVVLCEGDHLHWDDVYAHGYILCLSKATHEVLCSEEDLLYRGQLHHERVCIELSFVLYEMCTNETQKLMYPWKWE